MVDAWKQGKVNKHKSTIFQQIDFHIPRFILNQNEITNNMIASKTNLNSEGNNLKNPFNYEELSTKSTEI